MLLEECRADIALRLPDWDGILAPAPPHARADLALSWPLAAAKKLKKNPFDIAAESARAFEGAALFERAQPVRPGYLNLHLALEPLWRNLSDVVASVESYGRLQPPPREKILLEFVSANPSGPLHAASGRAAALGDSLAKIMAHLGYRVSTECYLNDAGRQVELLGESLRARHRQSLGEAAEIPEGGYQGAYLADLAQSLGPEAKDWSAQRFSRFGVEHFIAEHQRDMDLFAVKFDGWFKETSLHERESWKAVLEKLRARGKVFEKDGAVWLASSEGASDETATGAAADDKDRVLVKNDGRPTYFLMDIAYHQDKMDRGMTQLIDILGADHHGYVPRMKVAMAELGYPPESFRALVHQMVHLYRGQQLIRMSKRAGEMVLLKELLDEVGRDACRFFFAMRTPNSTLKFDIELAQKKSQENPVFYVQYVHARICSIFREAEKSSLSFGGLPSVEELKRQPQLGSREERDLLVKLAWFPEILKLCVKELSPHHLASYLLELAGLFHPFYEKCRVVDASAPDVSRARLGLCLGVRLVIEKGLSLLGVSAPQQM